MTEQFIGTEGHWQEDEHKVREYLQILFKHKWTVLFCFVVFCVSSIVLLYSKEPLYRGVAKLVIEKNNPKSMYLEDLFLNSSPGLQFFETEFQIIQGRTIAKRLVEKLNLAAHPEFNTQKYFKPWAPALAWRKIKAMALEKIQELMAVLNTGQETAPPSHSALKQKITFDSSGSDTEQDKDLRPYVNAAMRRIHVSKAKNSHIVRLSFTAHDPQLAARATNALAQIYKEYDLETRTQNTQQAIQWLYTKINEERMKAEQAELKILEFKEKHEILTSESAETGELTTQKILEFKSRLTKAKNERVEAEYRYHQAKKVLNNPVLLESSSILKTNPSLQDIRSAIFEIRSKLSELSKKYGPNHPTIVNLKSDLQTKKRQQAIELKKFVDATRTEYELALARESSVRDNLKSFQQDASNLNKKAVEFQMLKKQAEQARETLDIMLERFKEATFSQDQITSSKIRIIDQSTVPSQPINREPKNIFLGAVLGLMLGLGLSFSLEYLDNTVKSPEDIKRLGLPYFNPVPMAKDLDDPVAEYPEIVVAHTPKAAASEAYRTLRSAVLFSSAAGPPQLMLITSPSPREGKTITCVNLAATMAQSGSKTLLIDCDLRRPRLHKIFNLDREVGLTHLLTGSAEAPDTIRSTNIENLYVLPSGPIPPNPSELLGSDRMRAFLQNCRKEYDRILIDSPPAVAVTDSAVISQLSDGVILVIMAAETKKQMVKNTVEIFNSMQIKMLGTSLNSVDMGREPYYYYQYYYYYYGQDNEKQRKKRRKKRDRSQ